MNFNYIDKKPIDKTEFDSYFKNINENSNIICFHLYKIASIIANNHRTPNLDNRENMIQDSVYTAYRRINSFDVNRGKSAFGYFYKLISNHFKDILRKSYRRQNIATFVSYDLSEDNSIKYIPVVEEKKCEEYDQFCFIKYNEVVTPSFVVKSKRNPTKKESLEVKQTSFLV